MARSNTLMKDQQPGRPANPDDLPVSLVLSAMGQEENNPEVNVLLSEPQYVAPSLLTFVVSH